MQEWLQKDPEVNRCRRGSNTKLEARGGTALHWAAYFGRVEIAELLLKIKTSKYVYSRLAHNYVETDGVS